MPPTPVRNRLFLGAGLLSTSLLIVVLARAGNDAVKKDQPAPPPAPEKKADAPSRPISPLGLLLPDVQRVREAAARAQAANNLRQIGLAVQQYQGQLPKGGNKEGKPNPPTIPPYYGGTFFPLLPYIEQNNLYQYQPFTSGTSESEARLGAQLEPVGDVLRTQLDLGKNQGQVLFQLKPGGPAEKAGLKRFDVLLQLNGSSVSNDPVAFIKALKDVKEGTKLNALVLRGGKRTEVKGLVLDKVSAPLADPRTFLCPSDPAQKAGGISTITDGTSNTILWGEGRGTSYASNLWNFRTPTLYGDYRIWSDGKPILATTQRNKERFITRHQEGSLVITVIGTVKDGKAQPKGIKVQEGTVVERYTALDKVPEEYRDKVAHLLELSAKEKALGSDW